MERTYFLIVVEAICRKRTNQTLLKFWFVLVPTTIIIEETTLKDFSSESFFNYLTVLIVSFRGIFDIDSLIIITVGIEAYQSLNMDCLIHLHHIIHITMMRLN